MLTDKSLHDIQAAALLASVPPMRQLIAVSKWVIRRVQFGGSDLPPVL